MSNIDSPFDKYDTSNKGTKVSISTQIKSSLSDMSSIDPTSGEFIQDLIDNVNRLKEENKRLAESWFK